MVHLKYFILSGTTTQVHEGPSKKAVCTVSTVSLEEMRKEEQPSGQGLGHRLGMNN